VDKEGLVGVRNDAGFIGIATWHADFARWNARSGLTIDHFLARRRETGHWL
jgi:hypothetical protein